mgnify:FL=1
MQENNQTSDVKTKQEMLEKLDVLLNEDLPYHQRLEAYEYLLEDCEPILEDMIDKIYTLDGETGKMLMEILAEYKGNKAIFMGLVSYLYKGEDVALFARLIGAYGDEQGIEVLKTFCENYEPNYNEYMELRNAVEELGGDFDLKQDFSDDPFYRFLKGLDEVDDESRQSPFEDYFKQNHEHSHDDDECDDDCDCEDEDCDCDDDECRCHDEDCDCDDECHCHHHDCDDDDCHCHE